MAKLNNQFPTYSRHQIYNVKQDTSNWRNPQQIRHQIHLLACIEYYEFNQFKLRLSKSQDSSNIRYVSTKNHTESSRLNHTINFICKNIVHHALQDQDEYNAQCKNLQKINLYNQKQQIEYFPNIKSDYKYLIDLLNQYYQTRNNLVLQGYTNYEIADCTADYLGYTLLELETQINKLLRIINNYNLWTKIHG